MCSSESTNLQRMRQKAVFYLGNAPEVDHVVVLVLRIEVDVERGLATRTKDESTIDPRLLAKIIKQ